MSSSPPRPKKARVTKCKGIINEQPKLTIDLWVEVVDYLRYGEMMTICEVSQMFLKEIIPQITSVAVSTHNDQILFPFFPAFAKRLRGATTVSITGIFEVIEDGPPVFDERVLMQIPPFLSNLASVDYVAIRGWKEQVAGRGDWVFVDLFEHKFAGRGFILSKTHSQLMRAFASAICLLSASGNLSRTFQISRLLHHPICTHRGLKEYDNECRHCKLLCRSYNIQKIIHALIGYETNEVGVNVICLHPETALKIICKRRYGKDECCKCIDIDMFLRAIENEKYRFLQAIIELGMLPLTDRADIDAFAIGSFGSDDNDIQEPCTCIYEQLLDSLVNNGIPLKKSDFMKVFIDEDDYRQQAV